jgi:hypothetical protein
MDDQRDGPPVGRGDVGAVNHVALWSWITDALDGVALPVLDRATLTDLCLQALDTHAPAQLIHAQAGGIALEHLVARRLTDAYGEHLGRRQGRYTVGHLRATTEALREQARQP